MIAGLGAVALLALAAAAAAQRPAPRLWLERRRLGARIDALLPQTQCEACGYRGCRPYAEALASGTVGADRCPPGGDATARALAEMLGEERAGVTVAARPRLVARIDEDWCIGCTKCIRACPVDVIIGAPRQMHTVIAAPCTGCGLCLPPCPVDCIVLEPVAQAAADWRWPAPERGA